jgi:hypothetical protein
MIENTLFTSLLISPNKIIFGKDYTSTKIPCKDFYSIFQIILLFSTGGSGRMKALYMESTEKFHLHVHSIEIHRSLVTATLMTNDVVRHSMLVTVIRLNLL